MLKEKYTMVCNKGNCRRKSNKNSSVTDKSNDCCFVNKYLKCKRTVNCSSNKYRPYCAICPPQCKGCSESISLHLISGSSDCCDKKAYKNYCGIYNRGNCNFVDPYGCGVCPINPKYESSLSSSCFGSNPCSSSSSCSSKSTCSSARAPSACVSCPSDSCKSDYRVQGHYKKNRNNDFYNPKYNYKISKGACGKKVETPAAKCVPKKAYNAEDYKRKIEQDKKKSGILIEVARDCFKVDGQKRKTIYVKEGETYTFNVVQQSTDGLYHHQFLFTTDTQGGRTIKGKKVYPTLLKGAPKPCAHGTVKLCITKNTPKTFYYQDMNAPNMGGKVIVTV